MCTWPGLRGLPAFMGDVRRALRGPVDVVHVHAPMLAVAALPALLTARRRPPRVVTVHSSYPNYRLRHRFALAVAAVTFHAVVCCGDASRASMPRWLTVLGGRRLQSISNGVDIERLDAVLSQAGSSTGRDGRIAVVGRLVPVKDHQTTLEAFALVAAVAGAARLHVVGDGPEAGRVRALVDTLRLSGRVELAGALERDDAYLALAHASVFLSCSGVEGLPVAVLEAMAAGCRLVLSDIPAHRAVAGGLPGVEFAPAGDVEAFAAAILRALEDREGPEAALARRQRVIDRHSSKTMLDEYEALYRRLPRRR